MDETKETPTVNKEGITRRDVLKLAGLAVGGFILEQITSPIKNIDEFLTYISALQEGNPLQRLGTFQELNRRILLSPTNENKDLLVAWLKMNVAEYYFAHEDKLLTSQFIRHFLYGNGQTVDISNSFVRAAIQSQEARERKGNFEEQWSSHNQDPLVRFFERTVDQSFYTSGEQGARILEPSGDNLEQLSKGQIPESRFLKYRVYPGYEYTDPAMFSPGDIYYSLSRYTLVGSGTIKDQPSFDDKSRSLHVVLVPVKFTIIDRYDWTSDDTKRVERLKVVNVRVRPYIFDFMKTIGVKDPFKTVHDLVGPEKFNQLGDAKVHFSDKEGHLIERSNYGHPFDISGTINLSGLELRIPQKILKQSLEQ